jgi:calcineurin-like phosphoesterase family protein
MRIKLYDRQLSSIWITADTHFQHANILRYCERPFATIQEHDAQLIANWNDCVGPKDIVFHLGDFGFKSQEENAKICAQLNGEKYWVMGNHDKGHPFKLHAHDVIYLAVGEQEFVLCHYALRTWHRAHHGSVHLYGHSHNSLPEDPGARSMDVGVDSRARHPWWVADGQVRPENYRPFRLTHIMEYMATKEFKAVDHHKDE